jgi:hypothetical protein
MTVTELKSITDAVRVALLPDFAGLHEKINVVSESVAVIDERTSKHMPTREQVALAIEAHVVACRSSRRWLWGVILGLPAVAASVAAIVQAFAR